MKIIDKCSAATSGHQRYGERMREMGIGSFNFRIGLTSLLNLDLMGIIIFVGRFVLVVTLPVQPLADLFQVQPNGRLGLRRLKSVPTDIN